jgi:hypothetical protein
MSRELKRLLVSLIPQWYGVSKEVLCSNPTEVLVVLSNAFHAFSTYSRQRQGQIPTASLLINLIHYSLLF